jgi:hypothetical protein
MQAIDRQIKVQGYILADQTTNLLATPPPKVAWMPAVTASGLAEVVAAVAPVVATVAAGVLFLAFELAVQPVLVDPALLVVLDDGSADDPRGTVWEVAKWYH